MAPHFLRRDHHRRRNHHEPGDLLPTDVALQHGDDAHPARRRHRTGGEIAKGSLTLTNLRSQIEISSLRIRIEIADSLARLLRLFDQSANRVEDNLEVAVIA